MELRTVSTGKKDHNKSFGLVPTPSATSTTTATTTATTTTATITATTTTTAADAATTTTAAATTTTATTTTRSDFRPCAHPECVVEHFVELCKRPARN